MLIPMATIASWPAAAADFSGSIAGMEGAGRNFTGMMQQRYKQQQNICLNILIIFLYDSGKQKLRKTFLLINKRYIYVCSLPMMSTMRMVWKKLYVKATGVKVHITKCWPCLDKKL